ncbi:hypothetical protein ACFS32_05200 [Novosphingobium pokkalii]|uniref:hypothetical protein n=1 Tax=Novosphingobium pokkalii TaxID=1770194 RepID=UPI00363F3F98
MTAEVSRRNMIAGTVGMAGMLPVLAEAATGAVKAPGNATGFTLLPMPSRRRSSSRSRSASS